MLLLFMAVLLFLEVAADFARSLLDKERAYASYQGPPKIIPVTWHQVVLAFALSCLYFFVIFEVLKLFFLPSGPGLVLVLLGVLVLSSLAAWRNTRLWWREGTDYQQALREEAHMSRKLRIPPVR